PVSRDGNAININPAGMTQIKGTRYDGSLVPFWAFNYKHADEVNDEASMDSPLGILANQSYVTQAYHPDLRFGVGVFVSGGTGVGYKDLNTIYGTRDEYSAVLGVTKLASAVAWQANDKLSLGLGLNLTYSSTRQKLFPNTSFDGPKKNEGNSPTEVRKPYDVSDSSSASYTHNLDNSSDAQHSVPHLYS
ncbi:hypothetical protein CSC66_17090, partial [Pseudoxanthomonas kaohsiungensis]|uniref:outer membrane protein transport protein n=1 Tax=Pseudoxanthomonas kaohsiungensis TaxID=283923 RepID=UPI00192F2519